MGQVYETIEAIERRRRRLRIILFGIILTTLPFYCLGFALLLPGALQQGLSPQNTRTPTPTLTPIGLDVTITSTLQPTIAPIVSNTPIDPLQPTPFQFIPPTRVPPTLTFTPIFIVTIPTSTPAPSLTLVPQQPTNTPVPAPSNTPVPAPTDTPVPVPTDTPVPLPTDTPLAPPTETPLPPPSDTPVP
jgi:hypothetical protein